MHVRKAVRFGARGVARQPGIARGREADNLGKLRVLQIQQPAPEQHRRGLRRAAAEVAAFAQQHPGALRDQPVEETRALHAAAEDCDVVRGAVNGVGVGDHSGFLGPQAVSTARG